MAWAILADPESAEWFAAELQPVQAATASKAAHLGVEGPNLGRPAVDTVEGSAYSNMKELRVQVKGQPYRILFAFDPARRAILLLGGNKAGDKRWYEVNIPIADARYAAHLARLAEESK